MIHPLSEINDDVALYFRSLGYSVTWDFNQHSGEYWYEILDGDGMFCQIDIGVPLADLVEDFTCFAADKPGTSKSDYKVSNKKGCPRLKLLLERVAKRGMTGGET